MPVESTVVRLLLCALLAIAAGCASDDDSPVELRCEDETRAATYTSGMVVDGDDGVLSLSLVEATPAPPDKGNNDWLVELRAVGSTAPIDGATLVATEFMPDHGHGSTPPPPTVTPAGGAGQYRIEDIDLWMPGLWEVQVDITTDAADDRVVFAFCVEG